MSTTTSPTRVAQGPPTAAEPFQSVRHGGISLVVDTPDVLGISLCLSETFATDCRVDERRYKNSPRVGDFALLVPGHPVHVSVTGDCRTLQLWLPVARIGQILKEEHGFDGVPLEFASSFDGHDLRLLALMIKAATAAPAERDVRLRAVVSHLCLHHALPRGRATLRPPKRGGLTPARLRRVVDHVEAHLAGPVALEALATEAGLSPYHFAREFKRSVGTSPYSYVLERRLGLAITLLSRRGTGVEEAAHRAGFAHASHLSRHLRSLVGCSAQEVRALAQA